MRDTCARAMNRASRGWQNKHFAKQNTLQNKWLRCDPYLQVYKKRNEERRQQEQQRKIAREREVEAEITKRQMERLQREARVQQAQKEVWFTLPPSLLNCNILTTLPPSLQVWFKKREEVAAAKAELQIYKEKTSRRQHEAVC